MARIATPSVADGGVERGEGARDGVVRGRFEFAVEPARPVHVELRDLGEPRDLEAGLGEVVGGVGVEHPVAEDDAGCGRCR